MASNFHSLPLCVLHYLCVLHSLPLCVLHYLFVSYIIFVCLTIISHSTKQRRKRLVQIKTSPAQNHDLPAMNTKFLNLELPQIVTRIHGAIAVNYRSRNNFLNSLVDELRAAGYIVTTNPTTNRPFQILIQAWGFTAPSHPQAPP